jgi:hypothetical protein
MFNFSKNASAYIDLAREAWRKKNFKGVAKYIQKVNTIHLEWVGGYEISGTMLNRLGKHQKATEYYKRAI